MRWKDLSTQERRWAGLELEVARGELPPRPRWRVEYARPLRLRVVCGRHVQLWARVDDWWGDWWLVVGERAPEEVLPAVRSEQVRQVRAEPGSERWYASWARRYAQWLGESTCTPLYPGSWRLTPVLPHVCPLEDMSVVTPLRWRPPERHAGAESHAELFIHEARPLRPWSPEDSPRVKAWRKRAREGTLPPLLLSWSASLGTFFILDGHDRLQAAQLEQVQVAALALWPVERLRQPQDTRRQQAVWRSLEEALGDPHRRGRLSTQSINAALLSLYQEESLRSVQRVWPLPQGRARWAREVRRRLVALGVAPDESEILYPLTHLPDGRPRRRRGVGAAGQG